MIKEIKSSLVIERPSRTDLRRRLPLAPPLKPIEVVLIITGQAVIRPRCCIALETPILSVHTNSVTEVRAVIGIKGPNRHIITHIAGTTPVTLITPIVTWHTNLVDHVPICAVVIGHGSAVFVGVIEGEPGEAGGALGLGAGFAVC